MKLWNSWSDAARTLMMVLMLIIAVAAYLKVQEAVEIITIDREPIPQVHVAANPNSGRPPLDVSFHSTVSGGTPAYSYAWTFGDGGSSTLTNPQHTYNRDGTFTATLVVTDELGRTQSDSITVAITVSPLTVSLSANPNEGEAPLDVVFTCSISGGVPPYSYTWDLGDGTSSHQQTLTHTYETSGTYTATMIVRDSRDETDADSITIRVKEDESVPGFDPAIVILAIVAAVFIWRKRIRLSH